MEPQSCAKQLAKSRKAGVKKPFASLCAASFSLCGFKIPLPIRFVPPGILLPKKITADEPAVIN